jgi:hypothetical protein
LPVRIEIPDASLTYFSSEAKNELENHLKKYSTEIIKEAERIEESLKEDTSTPEITRQVIKQSVTSCKNVYGTRKQPWRTIVKKITATLGMAISGYLCDFDKFKESTPHLFIFMIFAISGTVAAILLVFGGEDN